MFTFRKTKYINWSDEDLIEAIIHAGDNRCFGVLYERYGHLVLGLCIKYLKRLEEAQDMTAHIFEMLPKKLAQHEVRYFKSWLYQLSRNECLMLLRKKNKYFEPIQDDLLANEEKEIDEEERTLEIEQLNKAMANLKESQRNCISLYYIEQLSYQDIATKLEMTMKEVKSHLQNGKRKLKILLENNHE